MHDVSKSYEQHVIMLVSFPPLQNAIVVMMLTTEWYIPCDHVFKVFAGIEKFNLLMNMTKSMRKYSYNKIVELFAETVLSVSANILKDSAQEIR